MRPKWAAFRAFYRESRGEAVVILNWGLVFINLLLSVYVLVKLWTTKEFEDSFWSSLFSGVLATALGLILGFPIALEIDRQVRARSRKEEEKVARTGLTRAILVIMDALQENAQVLDERLEGMEKGMSIYPYRLYTSAWEVVKPIVIELLGDPQLQGRLAAYFRRTEELERFGDKVFEYSTLGTGGKEVVRTWLNRNLKEEAKIIRNESIALMYILLQRLRGTKREDLEEMPEEFERHLSQIGEDLASFLDRLQNRPHPTDKWTGLDEKA